MAKLENRDPKAFRTEWANDSARIDWLVDANPKRAHGKAHARFGRYFGAETVKEYLECGGTKADLRYDWQHNFLDLSGGDEETDDVDEIEDDVEVTSDDEDLLAE